MPDDFTRVEHANSSRAERANSMGYYILLCLMPYYFTRQGRWTDNWGGVHIHIFMFCPTGFFWKQMFLGYVNINIWIYTPPQKKNYRV
jgi:hypothetical protein